MSSINIISQVQYDIESIYRCYVSSKTSYYDYFFLYYNDKNRVNYYNRLLTGRYYHQYYVSCHVKVLHAGNYQEKSYYYMSYYKLPYPFCHKIHMVVR